MEYHDSLPALAALPRTAASLVAQFLLPCPPFPGRTGNVSTGITLDQRSLRRRGCRSRILLQWPHSQLPDVPEQYRRIGIDAVAHLAGASCGGAWRPGFDHRRSARSASNPERCAGDHPLYVVHNLRTFDGETYSPGGSAPDAYHAHWVGWLVSHRAGCGAVVSFLLFAGPFGAKRRLRRFLGSDARLGMDQFYTPVIPLRSFSPGCLFSSSPGMDIVLLPGHRCAFPCFARLALHPEPARHCSLVHGCHWSFVRAG